MAWCTSAVHPGWAILEAIHQSLPKATGANLCDILSAPISSSEQNLLRPRPKFRRACNPRIADRHRVQTRHPAKLHASALSPPTDSRLVHESFNSCVQLFSPSQSNISRRGNHVLVDPPRKLLRILAYRVKLELTAAAQCEGHRLFLTEPYFVQADRNENERVRANVTGSA